QWYPWPACVLLAGQLSPPDQRPLLRRTHRVPPPAAQEAYRLRPAPTRCADFLAELDKCRRIASRHCRPVLSESLRPPLHAVRHRTLYGVIARLATRGPAGFEVDQGCLQSPLMRPPGDLLQPMSPQPHVTANVRVGDHSLGATNRKRQNRRVGQK